MSHAATGKLIAIGGGSHISLTRDFLVVGRRESCDIRLPDSSVSGQHCELNFRDGCWYVRDLESTNGTRVNNVRIQARKWTMLRANDEITIAKARYRVLYNCMLSELAPEPLESVEEEIMSQSLMERAGLTGSKYDRPEPLRRSRQNGTPGRYTMEDPF
jgi:pSer/pThr/pTyr-binding forkhead associated (FHA) protein